MHGQDGSTNAIFLQQAIAAGPTATFILDAQHRVVAWNPACERLTGVPATTVVGTKGAWRGFYPKKTPVLANRLLDGARSAETAAGGNERKHPVQKSAVNEGLFRSVNGKDRYLVINARLIYSTDEKLLGCIETLADITDCKIFQRQFAFSAAHDSLTGLPNRELLEQRLQQTLYLARRNVDFLAVFWIRLNGFDDISQTFNDVDFETVLCTISRRLLFEVRAIDTVAYCGHGEFTVVASKFRLEEYIPDLAQRLRMAISLAIDLPGQSYTTDCSIGISIFPENGHDFSSLLLKAEEAANRAVQGSFESINFYSSELNKKYLMRLNLENQLKDAISNDEFSLYYQPKVSLVTGRMIGMEALLRWTNPNLGQVRPDLFIPLAETLGLIDEIGQWVFKTACLQYREWRSRGLDPLPISVNLSGVQLRNDSFIEFVRQLLQDMDVAATCLELEVTETSLMGNLNTAKDMLSSLKEAGFAISMDDFGTGYSSLGYLRQLPIDKLKIDRVFVNEMTSDPNSAAIIKATIAMAHALQLTVVAEGVETQEQLGFLHKLKCDEIQGYLYSRPLPVSDMEALLKEHPELPVVGDEESVPRRVLVVDDEPEVLSAVQRMLTDYGYEVETALDGNEGFAVLAKKHVPVVIADQMMTGLDGPSFLEKVKRLYPQTVRIAFTGGYDLDLLADAVNKGAIFKFFFKPWNEADLIDVLDEAFLYYRSMHDQRPVV